MGAAVTASLGIAPPIAEKYSALNCREGMAYLLLGFALVFLNRVLLSQIRCLAK